MTVNIPDQVLDGLDLSEEQARLELALALFRDGRVTLAKGARIAALPFLAFQRELSRRRIPLHYGITDFDQDVETTRGMVSR